MSQETGVNGKAAVYRRNIIGKEMSWRIAVDIAAGGLGDEVIFFFRDEIGSKHEAMASLTT